MWDKSLAWDSRISSSTPSPLFGPALARAAGNRPGERRRSGCLRTGSAGPAPAGRRCPGRRPARRPAAAAAGRGTSRRGTGIEDQDAAGVETGDQGRHRLVVQIAAEDGGEGIVQIRHQQAPAGLLRRPEEVIDGEQLGRGKAPQELSSCWPAARRAPGVARRSSGSATSPSCRASICRHGNALAVCGSPVTGSGSPQYPGSAAALHAPAAAHSRSRDGRIWGFLPGLGHRQAPFC